MNLSKISVRYAKAIFMLAKDRNILEQIYNDFIFIHDSIFHLTEFKTYITSPVVLPEDKKNMFSKTFGKFIHETTLDFLMFIVDKGRELQLIDIIRYYEFLYRKEFNINEVIVTTPNPLSTEIKDNIANMVADVYKSNVEITNKINEKMIGGIVIRIDNKQLDLSIRAQLEEIKKSLKSESYKIGL